MRFLLLLLVLQCAVIQKGNPLPRFPEAANTNQPVTSATYFILNQESYKNGFKGKSESSYNTLLAQLKDSGQFPNIQTDIEKADLILEIEIQTRKENNRYLPFFTVFTLTLVPYFQTIELSEKFRLVKKNGDIVFQSNRSQRLNYWFGLYFFVKGMIQFSAEDNHNRFGFEGDLIEKMNLNIIEEMKTK